MYQGGLGGGAVLGATSTVASAIVLPNTGSQKVLAVTAIVTLITGVLVTITSVVRIISKRAYK